MHSRSGAERCRLEAEMKATQVRRVLERVPLNAAPFHKGASRNYGAHSHARSRTAHASYGISSLRVQFQTRSTATKSDKPPDTRATVKLPCSHAIAAMQAIPSTR